MPVKAHLNASADLNPEAQLAIQSVINAAAARMGKTYVLFHTRSLRRDGRHIWCMDGLFAAYAAMGVDGPEPELVPAVYGQPPALSLEPGDIVYLLDLTYPAPVLEAWADAGATVQVIDHHKSAMNDLAGLSDRVFREFDMERSGAVMAWEHFWDGPPPALFSYVQDRDIWTKALPDCDLIAAALREKMEGKTLGEALAIIHQWALMPPLLELRQGDPVMTELVALGKQVQIELDAAIAEALARHTKRLVLGHEVVFFACWTKRQKQAYSDIGHALLKAEPSAAFAVVQSGEGWALRSNSSHMGVDALALTLGGGGHRNASGCGADLPLWAAQALQRVLNWRTKA